jgi:hypothetical protein
MPNPIKYTAGTETLALKKGNFYIGTGDVGKGPSDSTGYYQGPSPASGGYVIYLNKSGVPGNLSYHSAANDSQLISFTNNLAGTSFTSATQCLVYYAGQTDKVCVNRDYEPIVTNGLVLNVDAGFSPSYSRSGTTWYDVSSGGNNGTLTNGPTFSTDNGGTFVFDGTDDYINCGNNSILNLTTNFTLSCWFNANTVQPSVDCGILGKITVNDGYQGYLIWYQPNQNTVHLYINGGVRSTTNISKNTWYNISGTYNGITSKLYLNGELKSTDNVTVSANASNSNFWIGQYDFSDSREFAGKIPIVQIYNKELTASEVSQNYNAQKGRFGL